MIIELPLKPVAKQSYRSTKAGFGYQSKTVVKFKNDVRKLLVLLKGNRPFFNGQALECHICFEFAETAGNVKKCKIKDVEQRRYKTTRPDIDNLCKAILDALNGIVFDDDSSIVELHCKKLLTKRNHITVSVYPVQGSNELRGLTT